MLAMPISKNKRSDVTIDKDYEIILKRMRKVTPKLSKIPYIEINSCLVLPLSNVHIDCGLKSKVVPMCLIKGVDEKLISVLGKLYPMMLINMYTYKVFELLFSINNTESQPAETVKEVFDITKASLNLKEIKSTKEHTKLQKELQKPLNWNIVSKMIECSDNCAFIIVNNYDKSKVIYNAEFYNKNSYIIFNYAVDDMTLMYVNL
jgi:hypothetical protein